MFYTIYKTTNLLNGKFYIGKHKTRNLNDSYMGSGKLLRRAIKKYGIENFHKEILFECRSEEHMNTLEKILVVPDPEINYNLCEGGKGGWSFINRFYWTKLEREKHNKKVSPYGKFVFIETHKPSFKEGGIVTAEKIRLLSSTERQKFTNRKFSGKTHTEEWKLKHSSVMKNKQKGKNNSQYGTCWITNGVENKKIKKEELDFYLELGYYKGRIASLVQ